MSDPATRTGSQWATSSGDAWAELWEHTDRGLEGFSSHLLSAILAASPEGSFRAFDVGCGPGSTSIALADSRPDASIVACDISPALVRVAKDRTADRPNIEVVHGDAEVAAAERGSFDLILSRHGVMFFPDPVRAFRSFRAAARPGASIVFSCFQDWLANPWASELASAAAGKSVPPPGREPSGFAFADPAYVAELLAASGWTEPRHSGVSFNYVVGSVDSAMSFLTRIGPASAVLASLPDDEREEALNRMRQVLKGRLDGGSVSFPAAAWIWSAKVGAP